ncbi:extracellular solute-binding protein [Paraburkholderia phenoliruptrix]|uniref:extracellular solute-binding protein n=1 Tax=Paraburkholderia phenoliruptrix TaxID=252970 RepID=UPI002869A2BF|nr:extracellular solute-binding protein [Paraburkholderia phenoliruptrix]WMY10998.1 extracellular solute-binding protein [Paraburkholderia phenoliruptrix]
MHSRSPRLFISGLLIIATLVAFGRPRAAELSVLYAGSDLMAPVQNNFKAHFERTHSGDKVSLEGALEYTDARSVALRESVVGALQDVGYYCMSDVCILAQRGIAKPLDDSIKNDPDWSSTGVSEKALDVTRCNGVIYGLPFSASVMVVMYNKKLVAKAGWNPNALPTTWPDILRLARSIQSTSGGIAINYDGDSSWSFMTLAMSRGGKILAADGKDIAFDSKQGLEALQILADIGAARNHVDMTKAQARQAFISGTLGILVDSSSGLANYKKAARGEFEIGVVPFPVTESGRVPASGMAGILQTDTGKKKGLAWDYLKYSVSADGQTVLGKMTSFQPFNNIAVQSADKLGTYYSENPELLTAAKSLKNAAAWPSFPGPNGLKIQQVFTIYLQKVYTGTMTPDAALAEIARETSGLLK